MQAMTNRQWLMWQIIDMSDEELIKNFGSMCEVCKKYITSNKPCPANCDSLLLDWLKKEYEEG